MSNAYRGAAVVPDFLGSKLVEHGGSISVSTARFSFVPEHGIGVIVMGNSGGMDYAVITESVLAILMGEEPAEVIPSLGVRARMAEFEGDYAVYKDLESLSIVDQDGLLYIRDGEDLTPMIPEDESYHGLKFNLLNAGRRTPVEFRRGDNGEMDMLLGRYVFHKK